MTLRAARQYSNKKPCGVDKYEDGAANTVVRRPGMPYYHRRTKGPHTSKNLVWKLEQTPALRDDQPRKKYAYGERRSDVPQNRNYVSYQPTKNAHPLKNSSVSNIQGCGLTPYVNPKSLQTVCKYWVSGTCKYGEKCHFLHSWCSGPGVGMLAALNGHKKDVKGIGLIEGLDKLFSASSDGTIRVWDCHSGQCVHVINLGAEVGSLICEGVWLFTGITNAVKALNVQTGKEVHLEGPIGQVYAMAVANEMLFAGTSSGMISVWKGNTESDPFKYVTSLKGHDGAVVSFITALLGLFSGSEDHTIKLWDLNTLQCKMTLRQHTNTVTSLLCWNNYLLSASLDGTVKVWTDSEDSLIVIYTHRLEHGVRFITGINDAEGDPIIFCSCDNRTVHIYDLPSFNERGKMFSTHTMGTLSLGFSGDGLIFSGDKSGNIRVWSLKNQIV